MRKGKRERALRKAEMEAVEAENMIAHKDEIFSRPRKTWFATEKEKKLVANAARRALLGQSEDVKGKLMSAEKAEELKMKEKRQRERERNLPRKKRRRLEASREMMITEDDSDQEKENITIKEKSGQSPLAKVAYRRAKSVKAIKNKSEGGKLHKNCTSRGSSRREEMQDLFQSDMNELKQARYSKKGSSLAGNRSKSSFKSKSRYKRRK